MIKTIIFDVGGIFVKGSFDDFLKKISKTLGARIYRESISGTIDDWMRGKITFKEFIEKSSGTSISEEDIKKMFDIWIRNWNLDLDMIEFAKKLKSKYRLIMLSDADREGVEKEDNGIFDFFELKFLSFELGLIKSEREIYEYVLKRIDDEPNECVFIDDKPKNVEVAKKFGIHGIVFENKEELKHDLEKLGIVVE